jgi:GT2 family glycosyltransferase
MALRNTPSVSLVVLNWNGRAHLTPCLQSLLALDYGSQRPEIILCDNGSSDGSVEYVRTRFPQVKVVALNRNHGFAEGNNIATTHASGEWVGFLNNDMWVEPSWLEDLVGALQDHPRAVCLASRIKNWDGSALDFIGGGVNYQGHGFQVDYGQPFSTRDIERRVLFACGGAMLVRRGTFLEVGGFDSDYFAFFEDVDLGWRLNLLGHEIWYSPRATAFHRHHGTANGLAIHKLRVLYERNALFTIYKCFEEEHLDRILPTALLLINERALRLAGHDPAEYRVAAENERIGAGGSQEQDSRPLAERANRVIRHEGPTRALIKTLKLIRWGCRSAVAKTCLAIGKRLRPDLDFKLKPGHVIWPSLSISHLEAISEFARSLDKLKAKRSWLQRRRTATDLDLIPLFEDPFFANYSDEHYRRFYEWITRVQDLDNLFTSRLD